MKANALNLFKLIIDYSSWYVEDNKVINSKYDIYYFQTECSIPVYIYYLSNNKTFYIFNMFSWIFLEIKSLFVNDNPFKLIYNDKDIPERKNLDL